VLVRGLLWLHTRTADFQGHICADLQYMDPTGLANTMCDVNNRKIIQIQICMMSLVSVTGYQQNDFNNKHTGRTHTTGTCCPAVSQEQLSQEQCK